MLERYKVSFWGVMIMLLIKNLSSHLAANGGSSLMACSITGAPPHNV